MLGSSCQERRLRYSPPLKRDKSPSILVQGQQQVTPFPALPRNNVLSWEITLYNKCICVVKRFSTHDRRFKKFFTTGLALNSAGLWPVHRDWIAGSTDPRQPATPPTCAGSAQSRHQPTLCRQAHHCQVSDLCLTQMPNGSRDFPPLSEPVQSPDRDAGRDLALHRQAPPHPSSCPCAG